MRIYKYFSHKFCTILQKQAISPIFCNQFGYWVTYNGGFGQNLTVFEKFDLVLFARAENQHNKKLKRRKEKNCQNIAIFQKILKKKHVYQQIRRVDFSIVNSRLLQVNSYESDIFFCHFSHKMTCDCTHKGQLISKCLFGVIVWTKKYTEIFF